MDDNKSINEFIGFMVVGLIVAAMLFAIGLLGNDPHVVAEIGSISPWMGAHVRILMQVAAGIIVIGGMTISFVSIVKDDGRLIAIGSVTSRVFIAVSVLAIIPAISFLISVGWFGAKNFFTH